MEMVESVIFLVAVLIVILLIASGRLWFVGLSKQKVEDNVGVSSQAIKSSLHLNSADVQKTSSSVYWKDPQIGNSVDFTVFRYNLHVIVSRESERVFKVLIVTPKNSAGYPITFELPDNTKYYNHVSYLDNVETAVVKERLHGSITQTVSIKVEVDFIYRMIGSDEFVFVRVAPPQYDPA